MITAKKIFSVRGFHVIYHFLLGMICATICKITKQKNSDIWIISERYNEARDNGYHLFKYITQNYKEQEVYYILDKHSMDYEKVNSLGKVVKFGSIKHHLLYWKASRLISTHIDGNAPNEKAYIKLRKMFKLKGKLVFLQHGVIKDLMPQCFSDKTKLSLFVCGAKPEYEFVKEKFGYQNGEVQYLGLCRYDNLLSYKTKKQILLMPTFRMEYFLYHDEKMSKEKIQHFENSDYFKNYNRILNDKKLIEKLEENDIKLIFYPHYEMQRYNFLYKTNSSNIIIAGNKQYDVQNLLKESDLLVTDFSSVFFDFAYMQKPIIYFQFDYDEYRKKHYREGYFSYKNDGFGKVVEKSDEVVDNIIRYITNKFKIEEEYVNRSNKFFVYRDTKNCERNYRAIKQLGEN